MADTVITITVPEAVVSRVNAAFGARYPNKTIPEILAAIVKDVTKSYEMEEAINSARTTAASTADTDLTGIG